MTKTNKRMKAVTAQDIARSGGLRIHDNGDIELLDEDEAETMILKLLGEVAAKELSRDRLSRVVH